MWPAIFAGAAGLTGGVLDYIGTQQTNEQNAQQFASNQAFNREEATNARAFSERMSNTSWQRGVQDMQKAGINPMAAFQQGGASTPTGAAATSSTGHSAQNQLGGLGRSMNSALGSALTLADIKNAEKEGLLKDAQALTQVAQADHLTTSATLDKTKTTGQFIQNQREMVKHQADQSETKARKTQAQLDIQNLARERILNQIKTGSGVVTDAIGAGARIKGLGLAEEALQLKGIKGIRTR